MGAGYTYGKTEKKRAVMFELEEPDFKYKSKLKGKSVTMLAASWNVAGKRIDEDISPWLMRGLCSEDTTTLPDILIIGLQEVVDLTARKRQCGYAMNATRLDRQCTSLYSYTKDNVTKLWQMRVEKCLAQMVMFSIHDTFQIGALDEKEEEDPYDPAKEYVCLRARQMVGLLSLVYIRTHLLPEIKNLKSEQIGTGFMGVGKNKGAIGIRFSIRGRRVLFVNMHLDSGKEYVDRRNLSFTNIQEAEAGDRENEDIAIYLGDMNYRLNCQDLDQVFDALNNGEWKQLLKYDQLNQRIISGELGDLREGKITFPPTYKLVPMTDLYDQDGKKRFPAWCDRILYWTAKESTFINHFYIASPLVSSDHKPVSSFFEIST
ncbi:hypothetical protein AAMO2058_000963600 [Amorphochlora amoebiformis]